MATKEFNNQQLELELLRLAASRDRWNNAWELISEAWLVIPSGSKTDFNRNALKCIRGLQADKKLTSSGGIGVSAKLKNLF